MPQNQTNAEMEYDGLMRRLERIESQVRHGAQCAARDHSAILNTGSAVENLDATMNHLTNGLAQNVLRPINNLTKLFENQQNALVRHEALLERHEKGLVALDEHCYAAVVVVRGLREKMFLFARLGIIAANLRRGA